MISLTFNIDNVSTVLSVFDTIQIRRYTGTGIPSTPIDLVDYTIVSGIDNISNIQPTSEVKLVSGYTQYYFTDPDGTAEDWYISRYFNSTTSGASAWTDPILGEPGDLYYDPVYPPEVSYGSADQAIIDRIRTLIGDIVGLSREYGTEAEGNIMPDGKTYVLEEKGWPVSINMNGVQYTETSNPSINGYRYLKFDDFIDKPVTVVSGSRVYQKGVDIWYYTFRWSDREIMDAFNRTSPPPPLNDINTSTEIQILACAYDLLFSETWEYINEDGSTIKDDSTTYDPSPGIEARADMLDKLKKRLDDAVKANRLLGLFGVRID